MMNRNPRDAQPTCYWALNSANACIQGLDSAELMVYGSRCCLHINRYLSRAFHVKVYRRDQRPGGKFAKLYRVKSCPMAAMWPGKRK
ncbi:hypothetical protein KQX54_006415 [Cotesia glomerata]|uniref:Uncharacterized protein n=1 Tax=Cotesia glomerata TaxID=32391 RepID=A0AAV7IJX9_COTGL|nr:hypothetical protein KQX54_006415 [Cotesia glomerata]